MTSDDLQPNPRLFWQQAPWPAELETLVERISYRPGWTFRLIEDHDRGQGSEGLTLDVLTLGYNSHHPDHGERYRVHHYMPVPPASYDRRSWQRWLFEQCLLIERHEAMEFFRFELEIELGGTTVRRVEHPYAPNHGPGNDPYIVAELSTDEDRRTSFRGVVTEPGGEHP